MTDAHDDLSAEGLFTLTVLATIVGLRLARSHLPPRAAATLGGLIGMALVAVIVGRLLPPPGLLVRELGYAPGWLVQSVQGELRWPLPFASAANHISQRLDELGTRLWWWSATLASGGVSQDSIALVLIGTSLIWAFGLFATWQIYRERRPLLGLLPGGVGIAVLAFFHGGMSIFYLLTYLGCTLCLLAICHLWARTDHWERTGTDYPGDMGMELALGLGPWLVVLLLLAAFFPVVRPRQIRDAFWNLMDEPWSEVVEISERVFGPIESQGIDTGGGGGSLPRAHLPGGAPELAETIMFYVATSDPPPPLPSPESQPDATAPKGPRRYWRSITYDTYTGDGWTNSPLGSQITPSGESLGSTPWGLRGERSGELASPTGQDRPPDFDLSQQFDLLVPEEDLIYAVNAPLQLDHPVQSWWRAPGDLALLSSNARRYTVISQPPEPTVAELRNVPTILPPDLAERYLALPDSVPQRVLDLAEEVAGKAETSYDLAHAIEFFLRTYTYTLDLPAPPTDQDLVDYFLFDLQQGYCDYYASAMVIMARAVGLPARLASGYAQGTYDHDQERWVVTEKDSHSWVEVYFYGIGWVEFEPTAGQPALTRTGGEQAAPEVPPLPPRTPGRLGVPWALFVLGGALLLVAVVLWIWRPRRLMAGTPDDLVRDRHTRLVHWGTRLGHPHRSGQTPFEYGTALSAGLRRDGQHSRWPHVRQASDELPPEVERLTETYVRAQYSPEPISHREGRQIRDLWTRLRRRLWWLWLGRH
jgi:transglutaminase-like putative cysteine protease